MQIERIINVVGVFSLVAGLIFVGMELRQSQRLALAAQQQERTAITNDMVLGLTEANVDFQSVYYERNFEYDLSTEKIAYRNFVHLTWFLYENDYYQYTRRLMDESTWRAKLEGITLIYNDCENRNIYTSRAPVFSQGFREIVQSLPDICGE